CEGNPAAKQDTIRRLYINRDTYGRIPANDVVIWISHRPPSSYLVNDGYSLRTPDYFVGRSMYEWTRLPQDWKRLSSLCNELWVPGNFVRHMFEDNGVPPERLFEIPESVDANYFDPSKRTPLQLPKSLSDMTLRMVCHGDLKHDAYKFISHFK